ncbi:MAG: DegV family protein [Liquorilactobacillus nagelii]
MMKKIGLLIDSATDVPTEVLEDNENIAMVPLTLSFGDQIYQDRITIQPTEFYQKLAVTEELPKTASPVIGSVIEKIQELKQRGFDEIIGITISAGLSITNQVFKQAAAEFTDLKITIINTKSIGIGAGLFAVFAADLIKSGLEYSKIINLLNASIAKSHVYFYIPTLKYLQAGGRIGKVTEILGSVLKIKPIISCNTDGIYYPITKARSEAKAIEKMVQKVLQIADAGSDFRIGVAHGADQPLMQKIVARLKIELSAGQKIYTTDVSPALGVHTGPGLVGIGIHCK